MNLHSASGAAWSTSWAHTLHVRFTLPVVEEDDPVLRGGAVARTSRRGRHPEPFPPLPRPASIQGLAGRCCGRLSLLLLTLLVPVPIAVTAATGPRALPIVASAPSPALPPLSQTLFRPFPPLPRTASIGGLAGSCCGRPSLLLLTLTAQPTRPCRQRWPNGPHAQVLRGLRHCRTASKLGKGRRRQATHPCGTCRMSPFLP